MKGKEEYYGFDGERKAAVLPSDTLPTSPKSISFLTSTFSFNSLIYFFHFEGWTPVQCC